MPNNLDFMKSRDEKGMPDEQFRTVREEYNKKADDLGALVKKIILAVLAVLTISCVALNIFSLANENIPDLIFIWLIAFIIIIALFLYDPKVEEDKRYKYETDQKIILNSLKNKVKANKLRLGAVIFIGVLSVIINIGCWWFIFDIVRELSK